MVSFEVTHYLIVNHCVCFPISFIRANKGQIPAFIPTKVLILPRQLYSPPLLFKTFFPHTFKTLPLPQHRYVAHAFFPCARF